jgi:CrcB protein
MKENILPIGLGGVAGSLMRYGTGLLLGTGGAFPTVTLFINCLGCFMLGAFSEWIYDKKVPKWLKPAVETGVIGSFTTFSAFSVETMQLFMEGHIGTALTYILLSVAGGLVFAWAGHTWMQRRRAVV